MSPVSKTRAPHFLVHNPNIYNPFLPPLSTIAHELSIRSHFFRLLIFNPRLKDLLSLSLAFSRLLLPPNRNPRIPSTRYPSPSQFPFSLVEVGAQCGRPHSIQECLPLFFPSFLHSFSSRKLFLSACRRSFHTISRRILFLSFIVGHPTSFSERENASLLRFCFANLNLLFVSLKIILAKKKIQLLQDSSYRLKK